MTPTKQKQPVNAVACAPGALPNGPVRTRFFDGMYLTQADLENEQRFWRLKRRLTNRALGDGVVWGLKLGWNQAARRFSLSPGYALDCCGNDLVVECPVEISEAELWSRADPALRGDPRVEKKNTRHACVVLQYTECAEDARPVHRDACGGTTNGCEPSRVRETARLVLVPPPARVMTPPERFLDELEAWANNLPASIKDAIFPPQSGSGTSTTPTSHVPMHVKVTVPGATPAVSDQQPLPSGATPAISLTATQTPTAARRTGVVTFELTPDLGWGFTAGTVLDQARTVETVTPPVAPSMFWSFDVAVGRETTTTAFAFTVDKLQLAQVFGGTRHGEVDLLIEGTVTVTPSSVSNSVTVTVDKLRIKTIRADVTESTGEDQGCFREAIPWGWTVDPANGKRIASTLVLSAVYGFLSEVVRRQSSPAWQLLATRLYIVTWYALFGAFPMANVADEHRRKLAELILDLYKRWCEGLAYPGPRCIDEHHGIYLGCAELDRSGRITHFDMWANRRYVVTGALLDHWARQFGVAPIDVIVGRFARAFCCVSNLPAITLPRLEGGGILKPGIGGENADDRFHVGTRTSVESFAKLHNAELRWATPAELAARTGDAFLRRDDDASLEVIATTIEDGGTIGIAVAKAGKKRGAIRDDVTLLARHGETRISPLGREPLADFAVALYGGTGPDGLIDISTPADTAKVSKLLAEKGMRLADVFEGGMEAVRSRLEEPVDDAVVSDLVDRAELSLKATVKATIEVLGKSFDRKSFGDAAKQEKLAKLVIGNALPSANKDAVHAAAKTAASG